MYLYSLKKKKVEIAFFVNYRDSGENFARGFVEEREAMKFLENENSSLFAQGLPASSNLFMPILTLKFTT